jgi:thiol-disulfide isomerase/thioredoxin
MAAMIGRRSLLACCAVLLCACATAGRNGPTPEQRPPTAPSTNLSWQQIPLADLDSHPVTLAKVLGGRPALVNLWAPWCERCKTELPDLDRLSRELAGCAVVVGVAVGEDPAHTSAFVRARGLGYPQVVDEGFHLSDALRQSRVPTTLVIDGAGAIVHVGWALDPAAVGALKAALAGADATGHCHDGRPAGRTRPTNARGSAPNFRG